MELIERGEIERGQTCLDEAYRLGNSCARSLLFMGRAWTELGAHQNAIECLQRAVELDPNNPVYLLQLSLALRNLGEHDTSATVTHQAILLYSLKLLNTELSAGDLYNLGLAYHTLGDTDQALGFFNQSLDLDPNKEDALLSKALILASMPAHHDDALEAMDRLIALNPNNMNAICQKAKLLTLLGEVDESVELLTNALETRPNYQLGHYILAFARSICGSSAVKHYIEDLREYWQQSSDTIPFEFSPPLQHWKPRESKKIRLGFLIGKIGDHVVKLFLEPFLAHYDRNCFEVELLEMGAHHAKDMDHITSSIDALLSLDGLSVDESRRLIRSRGYHVIVDVTGFTRYCGLPILAQRCAKVQCHYIGFHASTGLNTIDWFIGDEVMASADIQDQFVERLWTLPRPWLSCKKESGYPEPSSLAIRPHPVLGSFNQYAKVRQETIEFWAATMNRIPEAELHLKTFLTESERPKKRILEALTGYGVDPGRVKFLLPAETRVQHLQQYRTLDVALDTTPWSGATTTFEALLMGVPVAGIHGDTMASRMTCSLLQELGRERWITKTPDAFAETVADLVRDLPQLRGSRSALRTEVLSSRLFDGSDLALHLQNAFTAMVRLASLDRSRPDHYTE